MPETKITVLITDDLRRQAKAAAALRGETLSSVVRTALAEYVTETDRFVSDPQQALRTDPLLSLRFCGGPGDAAERAEENLAAAADFVEGLGGLAQRPSSGRDRDPHARPAPLPHGAPYAL